MNPILIVSFDTWALAPAAQARVTYAELEQLLTFHLRWLHAKGLQPDKVVDHRQDIVLPVIIDETSEVAYLLAAAEKAGKLAEERARLVDHYRSTFANPYKAAELGYVDEVIAPEETRRLLIQSLKMLEGKRERGPSRKHGNIPL